MIRCKSLLFAIALTTFLAGAPLSFASAPTKARLMSSVAAAPVAMAWEWDWDSFRRFWGRQFGKTTGVVGIAGLIVGGGVLVIISAKHKS